MNPSHVEQASYLYTWFKWEKTLEWKNQVRPRTGWIKFNSPHGNILTHIHMHTETHLFLCCWDAVKHTLKFAHKTHACCYTEHQKWVVGVASLSVFQGAADTERRLCQHKKHVCLYTHTHTHTPYIIFVHNLICLSPPVYFAMVTTPTPLLDVSRAGSSRHTFLWFLGWRRCSQFTSLLMDVLTSAPLSKSQWAALLCEASGNDEKCRKAHTVSVVWLQPSGSLSEPDRLQCTELCLSANLRYSMKFNAYYLLQVHFLTSNFTVGLLLSCMHLSKSRENA